MTLEEELRYQKNLKKLNFIAAALILGHGGSNIINYFRFSIDKQEADLFFAFISLIELKLGIHKTKEYLKNWDKIFELEEHIRVRKKLN